MPAEHHAAVSSPRSFETDLRLSPAVAGITRRAEREAGTRDLAAALGERLPPSDAQAVLMDASRRRVANLRPARLLEYYRNNRFSRPSSLDPRALLRWDQIAFSEVPSDYSVLELAPLCPLGTVSSVTGLSQDWAVSTTRNTEVVSDPTNVLALEYAARRQGAGTSGSVKLAASHRAVRAQKFASVRALPHFRLFCLCSGGRDTGDLAVELGALREHTGFYLRALRRFLGPGIPLRLTFTDVGRVSHERRIETALLEPLRSEHTTVSIAWDPERDAGRNYYRQICFHVHARHPDGRDRELVDGGDVDWAEKLLNSGKERMVISGIGSEGLCRDFGSQ